MCENVWKTHADFEVHAEQNPEKTSKTMSINSTATINPVSCTPSATTNMHSAPAPRPTPPTPAPVTATNTHFAGNGNPTLVDVLIDNIVQDATTKLRETGLNDQEIAHHVKENYTKYREQAVKQAMTMTNSMTSPTSAMSTPCGSTPTGTPGTLIVTNQHTSDITQLTQCMSDCAQQMSASLQTFATMFDTQNKMMERICSTLTSHAASTRASTSASGLQKCIRKQTRPRPTTQKALQLYENNSKGQLLDILNANNDPLVRKLKYETKDNIAEYIANKYPSI